MSARTLEASLVLAAFGLASTAAVVTACGDDTAVASSEDAGAGTDAGFDAAYLPAPPPFDAGVEAGPVACGANACTPADFRGLATLGACCSAGACGVELKNAAPFVPVADVCMPLVNLGTSDDTCPTFPKPSELYPGDLQGCCRADKTCGVFVQLSSTLDLGCVSAEAFVVDAGGAVVGAPCGFDSGM